MQAIIGKVLWVAIVGIFLFVWFGGRKNKKKYVGQDMSITEGWYETSLSKYSQDNTKKAYFFTFDKNYLTQGFYMVDHEHNKVYESVVLYGDAVNGYETDFINHIIDYQHHHKISATIDIGAQRGNSGVTLSSYFKFDGKNIWEYLENLGYDYHFNIKGLAYTIDLYKDGEIAGTLYSSNGGKNYFDCEGPIQAKMGSNGYFVVECRDRDLDAAFLYALAFVKTELSAQNLK